MPSHPTPRKVQEISNKGHERLRNFRQMRVMLLRNFVGPYYDKTHGEIGTDPLNLIFNAIRILVPNVVMNFPTHKVTPKNDASAAFYAELMGLALDRNSEELRLREIYRRVLVDSLFMMGIMKTGLSESSQLINFDDGDSIDPGQVYTKVVDFDNLIVDPIITDLRDSSFFGDRMQTPRQPLLDSGFYENDLLMKLPAVTPQPDERFQGERASGMSQDSLANRERHSFTDEIELVELWVPEAQALVTIPAPGAPTFDKFLRVEDYYGPEEGPYTFMAITPPVPDNPMPVSLVSIWNDLHVMANRTVKKILDQAERQKDVVFYQRAAADDALEARDASDGDAIATDNPDGIQVRSFGGPNPTNVAHINQLQTWFNMMAANPQGVGGLDLRAASATEANILQSNASIGLEDLKDQMYIAAAEEGRKRGWYIHYDPLIEIPLPYRQRIPARFEQGPLGPVMMESARQETIQVILTPEIRKGDWLDYKLEIEPESMGREDSQTRMRTALNFATQVLPAAATAAQVASQMGVAFSLKAFLIRMAKMVNIEWMDEVFEDPEFQQQIQQVNQRLPQPTQATVQAKSNMPAILQNGQPATVSAGFPSIFRQRKEDSQVGANAGQAELKA